MANVRTFKNIQDEVLQWLDEAGDTDVTLALVKQSIRAAHEKRLTQERWPFMLSSPRTFTTVARQQGYSLDPEFLRALYFKNLTTTNLMLEYTDQNVLETGVDWTVGTGSASQYALWGHSEIANQPTAPSILFVRAANSSDNGLSGITVTGRTAAGMQTETILANASGTLTFIELFKVAKTTPTWAGQMNLESNFPSSGSTILVTVTNLILLAAEYGKSYRLFSLLALPTAGETVEYRFYRQPSPLVANNDRPDFPAPFETLLVWDALLDLGNYNEYSPNLISYWMSRRDELVLSMQQTTAEAQSINRRATYTEYIPR